MNFVLEFHQRRSMQNFLVRPKEQLRFAAAFSALSVVQAAVVMAIVILLSRNGQVGELSMLEGAGFLAGIGALAFLPGLALSHRFYGPLVPIQRHVRKLAGGKYESRVHLRRGDAYGEVQKLLNVLATELEKSRPVPTAFENLHSLLESTQP